MLKKLEMSIHLGKLRQALQEKGRVVTVKVSRSMTELEVQGVLYKAFKYIADIRSFKVLDCGKGGHLSISDDQLLNGERTVNRRGALYLCQEQQVSHHNT